MTEKLLRSLLKRSENIKTSSLFNLLCDCFRSSLLKSGFWTVFGRFFGRFFGALFSIKVWGDARTREQVRREQVGHDHDESDDHKVYDHHDRTHSSVWEANTQIQSRKYANTITQIQIQTQIQIRSDDGDPPIVLEIKFWWILAFTECQSDTPFRS